MLRPYRLAVRPALTIHIRGRASPCAQRRVTAEAREHRRVSSPLPPETHPRRGSCRAGKAPAGGGRARTKRREVAVGSGDPVRNLSAPSRTAWLGGLRPDPFSPEEGEEPRRAGLSGARLACPAGGPSSGCGLPAPQKSCKSARSLLLRLTARDPRARGSSRLGKAPRRYRRPHLLSC